MRLNPGVVVGGRPGGWGCIYVTSGTLALAPPQLYRSKSHKKTPEVFTRT